MKRLSHWVPKLVLAWSIIAALSVTQFADASELFGEHEEYGESSGAGTAKRN